MDDDDYGFLEFPHEYELQLALEMDPEFNPGVPLATMDPLDTAALPDTIPVLETQSAESAPVEVRKEGRVLLCPPVEEDYISLFDFERGINLYVPLKEKEETEDKFAGFGNTILRVPEDSGVRKAGKASPRVAELIANVERKLEQERESALTAVSVPPTPHPRKPNVVPEPAPLLVSKYSPSKFSELLSDEQTNFEALKWMREWDDYVFNRPQPVLPQASERSGWRGMWRGKELRTANRDHRDWQRGRGKSESDRKRDRDDKSKEVKEKDETKIEIDRRPLHKVLLLTGSPGVGKTTLANIVARHCGYRPVEVNASMERTRKELEVLLLSCSQHGSSASATIEESFQKRRAHLPNCLILDEIDGVEGGREQQSAISLLVSMCRQPLHDRKSKGEDGEDEKKTRSSIHPICRPVICICNNPYAPELRELREIARVLKVPEIDRQRLNLRLEHICNEERVYFTPQALRKLGANSDGDVRACLNTLQFLIAKDGQVNMQNSQGFGIKDTFKTLFTIWGDVFYKEVDMTSYYRKIEMMDEEVRAKWNSLKASMPRYQAYDSGYFYVLQIALHNISEIEKVSEGCYENYLHVKFPDFSMQKCNTLASYLVRMDLLNRSMYVNQSYQLRDYIAFCVAAFHFYCSTNRSLPKLEYPRTSIALKIQKDTFTELIRSWLGKLTHGLLARYTPHTAVLDLLTFLLVVAFPDVKVNIGNMQFVNTKDQAQIRRLVELYCAFQMKFVHNVSPSGHLVYHLVPPLVRCVTFGDKWQTTASPPPYQLSAKLSVEVKNEELRRAAVPRTNPEPKINAKAIELGLQRVQDTVRMMDQMEKAKQLAKEQKSSSFVKKDIFGRPIMGKDHGSSTTSDPTGDVPLCHFKYYEGFTNAVRVRPLLEEFL